MKCERCGRENYDESYYCRGCGLSFGSVDTVDVEYEMATEVLDKSGSYVDNNMYTKNLYSTEEKAEQDKTEAVDNYNYQAEKADNILDKNAQSSNVPEYIYNSEYDFYSRATNNRRTPLLEWESKDKITMFAVVVLVGVLLWVSIAFGPLTSSKKSDEVEEYGTQATENVIVESTQPTEFTTYKAELSHNKYTITDFEGEKVSVIFPVPEGYKYEDSGYKNNAVYKGVIDGGVVATLSAVVYEGELEKEIDYYEGLLNEDDGPLDVKTKDTDLGEMTVVTMKNASGYTVYQVYVKLDKKTYFNISLSNIPETYEEEAQKLIDMIVDGTESDPIEKEDKDEDKDKD